jgi:hypothetical protein
VQITKAQQPRAKEKGITQDKRPDLVVGKPFLGAAFGVELDHFLQPRVIDGVAKFRALEADAEDFRAREEIIAASEENRDDPVSLQQEGGGPKGTLIGGGFREDNPTPLG